MNRYKLLSAASLMLVFLAACGSSGIGDIFGGSSGSQTPSNYEIQGTVSQVDANNRSILLNNVSGYTSMLSSGGNSVRVYYDERTTVAYQGSTYRPEDLEPGDRVAIRVDESGNALRAESMTVLQDVSGGTSSPATSSVVRGTVVSVDTNRRTIEVNRGYGSNVMVEYDTATPVYFGNATYRPADLERGDEVEIRTRDLGSGRMAAESVTVTRNVSGGSSSPSNFSTLRGTVRSVDSVRRTIELESTNWTSGFNTGAGTGTSGRMIIQYGTNTSVEVAGQLHPITGLERGDVVDVQVSGSGSNLLAERVILVRNVRN